MQDALDRLITLPIVHLNGTARETLVEQREAIWEAANNLIEAMKQAAPNGRDYYLTPGS